MRYSAFVLPVLAALGTNFGTHARAILDDKKNGALVHRDPRPLPIVPVVPHAPVVPAPKPIVPVHEPLKPLEPAPKPVTPLDPVSPVEPGPPKPLNPAEPEPAPPVQNKPEPEAKPITDPKRLALLKDWQCGIKKRDEGLTKRAGWTKADSENPAKYLEWLQSNDAKLASGARITPDKIVFYTNGKFDDADAFVGENEDKGYKHFEDIFERDSSLYKDWNMKPADLLPDALEAQSEALGKYARDPLVFGAEKTVKPEDKTYWAKYEYPNMQDAGTITKMKDGATKPSEIDFQIEPPKRPASC